MIKIIKLKNKYYRKKYPNKYKLFVKYQKIRRTFRFKTRIIIPFSKREERLYSPRIKLNTRINKVEQGKYFQLNGNIHILNAISKANLSLLYIGLNELVVKNPANDIIAPILSDNELRNSVFMFSNSDNYSRYTGNIFVTPNDKRIQKLVKFIEISLFELSDDYIGISFEVNLSDEIKDFLNNIINGDCKEEEEFVKYHRGKKSLVTIVRWNANITREKIVNDYIIEIKCRVTDFLNKYLELNNANTKAPVSIDLYTTNYDLKNDKEYDSFLSSYNIHWVYAQEVKQMNTIYNNSAGNQDSKNSDYLFICSEGASELNRSAKIIINSQNEEQKMFLSSDEMINFYIITLYFYYLGDFDRYLTETRDNLYDYYTKKENKIYKGYNTTLKDMQKFKMMFKNVRFSDESCYIDARLIESINVQNKRYKELIKKYDDLELSFNNKMLVSNYRSTLLLAKATIILAVVSIIITLYLNYK